MQVVSRNNYPWKILVSLESLIETQRSLTSCGKNGVRTKSLLKCGEVDHHFRDLFYLGGFIKLYRTINKYKHAITINKKRITRKVCK